MSEPTAESLEAAREWLWKKASVDGHIYYAKEEPGSEHEAFTELLGSGLVEELALILDSHTAPLRAEIEELKREQMDAVEIIHDLNGKLESAEARVKELEAQIDVDRHGQEVHTPDSLKRC